MAGTLQWLNGPETVWTRYSGPDAITSVLGDSLTPVERAMRDMGEHQRLRDIERITGRRVLAFLSGIDIEHDISCEVFTLEPQSDA